MGKFLPIHICLHEIKNMPQIKLPMAENDLWQKTMLPVVGMAMS